MFAFVEDNNVIKYPIGIKHLKEKYPNVCFPKSMNDFDFSCYGVVKVETSDAPVINPNIERIVEGIPKFIDGIWLQNWEIENLSEEEKNNILFSKESGIRSRRDDLLSQSDWVVIKAKETGTNISAAWKNYRQALRDITEQEGFPHNVVWPDKPV